MGLKKPGHRTDSQTHERNNSKQDNNPSIVINPNDNIVITKEIGEYDVPVYSIEATQVKNS